MGAERIKVTLVDIEVELKLMYIVCCMCICERNSGVWDDIGNGR